MQNSSKPFPHNLNPIFLETTNWVLKEMIQTKKTLAKKNKKNIWCVWHGQTCSKLNSVQYSHQMHGGVNEFKKKRNTGQKKKRKTEQKRKSSTKQKKTKTRSQFLCKNCYDLWYGWNNLEGYGSFKAVLLCPNCPLKQWEANQEDFYFSKKIEQIETHERKQIKNKTKFKTEIGQRKIIASILSGNFYENYREQMELLGLSYLKKSSYYRTIRSLIKETNALFLKHLEENRIKMDLQNLTICIDAGWSSRRNANECCFIVIDQKTQLLFDLIVVTREIYSGASGNMEAEAAKIFCEKHKKKLIWLVLLKMATPS
ncbi:hypothetical protein M0813_01026 [Anaeramoeba flamelloides]|uniref:DUF659 domain-containing protein n=1 Tax=Anaeramoeba flamelloides TaxID=1746091 RepID=A0ABQ8X0N0_9EUKA|nr:hypothetical protein M0813_01026 [Anaeramoeba flamelloides]